PALRVAPRVHALVAEATAAGATAIIVDVRDNPGGALTDCGPIAVVVNGASASCAEFLALDLQGRGLVIGEQTAGVADSTTAFFALPNGAGLQVTTAMVQNADGSTYASSVMPDVPVDDDLMVLANGIDAPLQAALEAVREALEAASGGL
nr:hypothetical protein [Trueperaceae bacterium]